MSVIVQNHISILLPSYNYAHYIVETIESILAQDYPYWELIIIEDGSSDNSLDIVQQYATKDERIKCLQHANGENRGLSASLQLGISNSQYPYIAFLEADDIWEKNSLSERIAAIKKEDAVLVFNALQFIYDGHRDIEYNALLHKIIDTAFMNRRPPQVYSKEIFAINFIQTFSSVMVKREALVACNFNTPEQACLDKWLWEQVSTQGLCLYLPKALTKWRLHEQSFTMRPRKHTLKEARNYWNKKSLAQFSALLAPHTPLWLRLAKIQPHIFCYLLIAKLKFQTFGLGFTLKALTKKITKIFKSNT